MEVVDVVVEVVVELVVEVVVDVVDIEVDEVVEVLDELVDDVLDVVLLDDVVEVVVVVVVVVVGAVVVDDVLDDVVDDSIVSITDITESGSTTSTCASAFSRRTSPLSSSATKPFTLLENTVVTSLPSDSSLRTFAATLTVSLRMTMNSFDAPAAPAVAIAGDTEATGASATTTHADRKRATTRRFTTTTYRQGTRVL